MLGALFSNQITFEKDITDICKKDCTKIYALARIAPYMNLSKQHMVKDSFFQFAVQLLSTDLDASVGIYAPT